MNRSGARSGLIAALFVCLAVSGLPAAAGGPVLVVEEAPVAAPAPAVPDWQGPYVGFAIGKPTGDNVFGRSDLDIWSTPTDWSGRPASLKAGYDWQRGRLVFGVALDVYFGEISNPTTNSYIVACFGVCKIAFFDLQMLRGRVGITSGKNLFYATAGLARAYGRFTAQSVAVVGEGKVNGWTAGIGIERRLTDHITMTAEYRHTDLGALPLSCFATCQTPIKFGLAELGVAYRW